MKKRTKKLLHPGLSLFGEAEAKFAKVFCFFFSKKKCCLHCVNDERRYLHANPGVAAAGMNPLLHYIEHGQHEGRAIFAA